MTEKISCRRQKMQYKNHREKLLAFPGDLFPWSWW